MAEFWDSRPCNLRHSKEPIGSRKYFDEVESRKYFVEPHIRDFADFASWRGKSVLEVGCGIGTDAINFARAGAEYTGVELSSKSLEITRTRFQLFNLSADLIEGSAESLEENLRARKFDLIYSFGVLHHTPDLLRALNSIKALCHRDTIVKVMVYAKDSWKSHMIDMGLDQPEAQEGCPIANTYTKDELRAAFSSVGLNIVDMRQDHIFPYVIAKYLDYEYVREPWFEAMPDSMFRELEKRLGWHMLVTATLE